MAHSSARRKPARSKPPSQSSSAVRTDSRDMAISKSSSSPPPPPRFRLVSNGDPAPSPNTTSSSSNRKRKRGEGAGGQEPESPVSLRPKHSLNETLSPLQAPAHSPNGSQYPPPDPDPDLPPGTQLDNSTYTVHSVLGRGQFSTTYLATQNSTQQKVAIKRFHRAWSSVGLIESGCMLALPKDPHLVTYIAQFVDSNDQFYIVMEALCAERPLQLPPCPHAGSQSSPPPHPPTHCPHRHRALAIIISQLLTALLTLHNAGIIHTDLTPSNILYTSSSAGSTDIKLIDFSNALDVHSADLDSTDPDSYELQTPCYRAPEILLGSAKKVASKIDIWSVGVIALELLFDATVVGDGVEGAELLRSPVEGREGLVRRVVEVFGSVESCSGGVHWRGLFHEISWRWGIRKGEGKRAVKEKEGGWKDLVVGGGEDTAGLVGFLEGLCCVDEKKRWSVRKALRNRWLVKQVLGAWGEVLIGDGETDDDETVERPMTRSGRSDNEGRRNTNDNKHHHQTLENGADEDEDEDEEQVMLV
ncbi:kinase-like protein [Ascodesmis nigricans]|uniref:EKC/KEOPS complex subunit BUD32 n=1 Tax=Ascodesmis nigricans TaxID=341454 RepID=A0A4S2N5E7_9PEZI|nr:kinase-like protein [Ascodesmis nigricans]